MNASAKSSKDQGEFSMEKGHIVAPGSSDWFKTVSFGDVIKIALFTGSVVVAFTTLKSDLAHEVEMRQLLETRTQEIVTEMRQAQKENSSRTDARFAETQQRDRELMAEVKGRMDRMENKIDQALSSIPRAR